MPDNPSKQGRLIRLSSEHEIKDFDCENTDLNDFLLNDAKAFSRQLLAVTYLLENDLETVAFFSILNDKISLKDAALMHEHPAKHPPTHTGKMLKSYPAVKIARLAVNKNHKRKNIARDIIAYLIDSFLSKNKTGCRFITVDAYQKSLIFYEKSGFRYLTKKDKGQDTRLMYLDLLSYQE